MAKANRSTESGSLAPLCAYIITDKLKRLVALGCIKVLRKLCMMSDSQMKTAMAAADSSRAKRRLEAVASSSNGGHGLLASSSVSRKAARAYSESSACLGNVTNSRFPIRHSARQPLLPLSRCESGSLPLSDLHATQSIPYVGFGTAQIGLCQDSTGGGLNVASLQVVGQADKKFIICRTRGWLVAIDQHAADERVRLEELYSALNHTLHQCALLPPNCSPSAVDGVSVLVPPVAVLLTCHDKSLVLRQTGRFRSMGIQISNLPPSEVGANLAEHSKSALYIACAPTALLPRLLSGGERTEHFAKELLLSIAGWYTGSFVASTDPVLQPAVPGEHSERDIDSGWPTLVDLPTIILDTLKSISCRGAVKFNDSLSTAECQSIVARLSRCKFPEFCAHGRRSIAKIARLDCEQ
ncbi:DNA mismatch repair protein [Coemansia thaxteri]|uniref:DNA mismatch repair protein n=1 Tax=Coemansia thaxteri TaxID=2663907 RepID=A0A9W8B8Y2_9FUNG|nr:DNA mismatch repair protein [Coemansia thaxteri]